MVSCDAHATHSTHWACWVVCLTVASLTHCVLAWESRHRASLVIASIVFIIIGSSVDLSLSGCLHRLVGGSQLSVQHQSVERIYCFLFVFIECLTCFWATATSNGWMVQDATWCAGRPRPRQHCVRWVPSCPPPRKGAALLFGLCLLWWNVRPSQLLLSFCLLMWWQLWLALHLICKCCLECTEFIHNVLVRKYTNS